MPSLADQRNMLESFELPEDLESRYGPVRNGRVDASTRSVASSSTLSSKMSEIEERYRSLRARYLENRMEEHFFEFVQNFDGKTYQFPALPTKEEQDRLLEDEEDAKREVANAWMEETEKWRKRQSRYLSLIERKEELRKMMEEMEEGESAKAPENENDDADDALSQQDRDVEELEDVDETDREAAETKKTELIKRLHELQSHLEQSKQEAERLDQISNSNERLIEEMQRQLSEEKDDQSGDDALPEFGEDGPSLQVAETFRQKSNEERLQQAELSKMRDWYVHVRETVELLSDVKVLSIKSVEEMKESATVVAGHDKMDLCVELQLFSKHILRVGLCKSLSPPNGLHGSRLSVANASVTPTEVAGLADGFKLLIPRLDDLVRVSASLPPVQDLRYLVRETRQRIRAMTCRVDELASLRRKYVTKIGGLLPDYGFGGEDQDVICSIPQGLTVLMRLGPDCPLREGTSYIVDIVEVGGWDKKVVMQLKDAVNKKAHQGPMQIMDCLVDEITEGVRNNRITLPRTPELPKRS